MISAIRKPGTRSRTPAALAPIRALAGLLVGAPLLWGCAPNANEHVMPRNGVLFANAFRSGLAFLIDVANPETPRAAGSFAEAGEYDHAHSFERAGVELDRENGPHGDTGGTAPHGAVFSRR